MSERGERTIRLENWNIEERIAGRLREQVARQEGVLEQIRLTLGDEAAAESRRDMEALLPEDEEQIREAVWAEYWAAWDESRLQAGVVAGRVGAWERRGPWRLTPPRDQAAPPIVVSDREMVLQAEDALALILQANDPPQLYVRDGELVRLKPRSGASPTIGTCSPSDLRGWLDLWGTFQTVNKRGEVTITSCPSEVVQALMARSAWGYLPELTGIVAAPVYASDGSLCQTPGYQAGLKLYYHEGGLDVAQVSKVPEADVWWQARGVLMEEMLGDFPFVDDASRANALALLITPFVAPLMGSAPPLFFLDAPTPGTGKTYLAQAIISAFEPSATAGIAATREQEEWRKMIPALLLDGTSHILIDNVNHRLDSPELAMAATTGVWKGRKLGTSEAQSVAARAIWVLTGNNLSASDELVSRACWIRMDAGAERPDQRRGFRHEDLLGWVLENRGRIAWAALTLAANWLALGKPEVDLAFRNFTPWARRMGGLLATCAVPGFLANREQFLEKADSDTIAWEGFVETWAGTWGTAPTGVAQLYDVAVAVETFLEKMGDGTPQSQKTRLGRLLRRTEGRVYGAHRIVRDSVYQGAVRYRLEPMGSGETVAASVAEVEPED